MFDWFVSVPLRGLVVFNGEMQNETLQHEQVSVPLRGLVVFNLRIFFAALMSLSVSVPLRGLVVFNKQYEVQYKLKSKAFPSPYGD